MYGKVAVALPAVSKSLEQIYYCPVHIKIAVRKSRTAFVCIVPSTVQRRMRRTERSGNGEVSTLAFRPILIVDEKIKRKAN
jgi:hypothetical protein